MYVLYYSEYLDDGGVEKMFHQWISHFDQDIKVDIVTNEIISENYKVDFEKLGCRVTELRCRKHAYMKKYKLLCRYLSEISYHYEIAHIHTASSADFWFLAAAKRNRIQCRMAHSHNAVVYSSPITKVINTIGKPIIRKYATDYLACSRPAMYSLFGKCKKVRKKGIIIKNGIELYKFRYDETLRIKKRIELGVNENDILIGTVGRLSVQKNYPFLLELYAKIKEKDKRIRLIIIGGGPEEGKLKAYDKQEELNVIWTGVRTDVYELYNALDIFTITSLYEGFPVVTVEAQTNGLPCIVSEAVPDDAILLKSTQHMLLNEGVEKWCDIIFDTVKKLGIENRKNAYKIIEEKGYDIDDCTHNLADLYRTRRKEDNEL